MVMQVIRMLHPRIFLFCAECDAEDEDVADEGEEDACVDQGHYFARQTHSKLRSHLSQRHHTQIEERVFLSYSSMDCISMKRGDKVPTN